MKIKLIRGDKMEMATIKIHDEAMAILKSGLALEENILKMSLGECKKDLESFERKYNMSSEEFIQKFESGDLGDDAEWFDFLFAYRAYEHVRKKLIEVVDIVKALISKGGFERI